MLFSLSKEEILSDLKDTYNRIARDWVKDHSSDTWWLEGTDQFLSYLEPRSFVLDVGCGAGVKTRYLAERGHFLTGIDFSEEMIRISREQSSKGRFVVRDIHHPLNLRQKFDGVFAQAVLLHIPKKQILPVLRNIISPLKTGGYFYAAVKEIRQNQPEEEILKENDYGYEYKRYFCYYSISELLCYMERLGMQVVNRTVSRSGRTNWIQIIAKK